MLKYAKLYEDKVTKLHYSLVDNKKYQYYFTGYFDIPKLENDEWNKICRVSTINGIIIGYLQANICRAHCIIDSLQILSIAHSYRQYKVFERDLLSFFLILLEEYPVVCWSTATENPVVKKYRAFVETVGGNIVGTFHRRLKVGNKYQDKECYEVLSSPETINKIKQLRDRLK